MLGIRAARFLIRVAETYFVEKDLGNRSITATVERIIYFVFVVTNTNY